MACVLKFLIDRSLLCFDPRVVGHGNSSSDEVLLLVQLHVVRIDSIVLLLICYSLFSLYPFACDASLE